MAKPGKWEAMAEEITDEIFDLFAIFANHDKIANKIAQRFEGLSDTVYATNTEGISSIMPTRTIAQIHQLPTVFENFSF